MVRNENHESEKVLKLISTRVTVITEGKTSWRGMKKKKKRREREEKKGARARKGNLNNTQSKSKEGSYRR